MKNLTLVIPAKREEESLPIVLNELKDYDCSIIVVLEEIDIKTFESIKNFNCHKFFQKSKGYGNAIIEGINNVKTEYCCIINADGSMDPKYLKNMLKECNDKDLIFGSRYQKPGGGSDDDDFITTIGNFFFTLIGNIFFNLKITDILYTYILGKTSSFKKLNLLNGDFRICVELPIKAKLKKMRYTCLPSHERERIGGKKKVNPLKDGLLILSEIVKYFLKKIIS